MTDTDKSRYFCPKHGDQGRFVGITVELSPIGDEPLPASLESRRLRSYCMACWIDSMDENLCQLTEATGADQ